jgi:hypothetical protein
VDRIVEKIVEVPVEKIVEVPVEKIVEREVPVYIDKPVYIEVPAPPLPPQVVVDTFAIEQLKTELALAQRQLSDV